MPSIFSLKREPVPVKVLAICCLLPFGRSSTAVELSSPVTGTVVKLAGEPGDIVAVGAPLVVFETDGEVAVETADTPVAAAEEVPEAQPVSAAPEPKETDNTF